MGLTAEPLSECEYDFDEEGRFVDKVSSAFQFVSSSMGMDTNMLTRKATKRSVRL